jgi:hypothetical protein
MRTSEQERARFTWHRTSRVARDLDCSTDRVCDLVRAGHLGEPGAGWMNVGSPGRPSYRINPDAVEAFVQRGGVAVADAA